MFRQAGEPFAIKASEPREGVSPTRYVTGLPLEPVDGGDPFGVLDCHFVSKPWSTAWRAEQWANNMRVLRETIHDLRSQGMPVLVGGDFNRATWDLIGPNMVEPRFLSPGPTVDRIAVTKDVTVLSSRPGPKNGSNHFAVIARLEI